MIKVEQVKVNGDIVKDYDSKLSPRKLKKMVADYFDSCIIENNQIIVNNSVSLLLKNVTYLGIPHLFFKKRIQIPNEFKNVYNKNEIKGLQTFFVGVYSYNLDNPIFCLFNPKTYIENELNNSSAHVYSYDIVEAYKYGFYRKIDMRGNDIMLFNKEKFVEYISMFQTLEGFLDEVKKEFNLFNILDSFWASIPKTYQGIDCYEKMISKGYNNALQAEWFGFYFEMIFEEYLLKNNINDIQYYADKSANGIDLDLKFLYNDNTYGDLKTHNYKDSILGNDYETIKKIIDNDGTIFYIAVGFDPVMDKECDGVVTKYWNTKLNERDNKSKKLDSYINKMKNSVNLTDIKVLKIDKHTSKFLSKFNQGKNSNGAEREPKISISKRNISNFVIYNREKDLL